MFGKNKKEEAVKTKAAKPDYKITIWEDVGYSVREVKTFFAYRFVDDDKTPFIYNEDLKFMELYPQDIKDREQLDEPTIKRKLKETKDKLEKIRNKKIEDYKEDEPNTRDLERDIMKFEAKLRGLKFEKSASYVSFDAQGHVCFNFKRQGNTFFPFKWDTDTTTIFVPAEPVVKKAGILLRNKENKYLPKKLIETTTLILLVVAVIATIVNLFLGGWLWTKYDNSNLGEMARQDLEVQKMCSEIVLSNARALDATIKQTQKYINQTPTINFNGIIPD